MNNVLSIIKTYIEYPIGLIGGFIGQGLGLSKFLQIDTTMLVTERVIDGSIGLIFVSFSVVITHYIKKHLENCDDRNSKKSKNK